MSQDGRTVKAEVVFNCFHAELYTRFWREARCLDVGEMDNMIISTLSLESLYTTHKRYNCSMIISALSLERLYDDTQSSIKHKRFRQRVFVGCTKADIK